MLFYGLIIQKPFFFAPALSISFFSFNVRIALVTVGLLKPPHYQHLAISFLRKCAQKMYNSIMVKKSSGTTIRKKTYMGDRKLVKAIIDLSCETIEDWAFANCHCLKEVCLPLTIREVSEKAFLNCDASNGCRTTIRLLLLHFYLRKRSAEIPIWICIFKFQNINRKKKNETFVSFFSMSHGGIEPPTT